MVAMVAVAACGKKGPPLAPLRLVPEAPAELTVRRTGNNVQLRFTLPKKNANGPGAVALDRVEIYAIMTPPGAVVPANRDLLTKAYVVGTIAVKPPAVEGEPAEERASDDKRPSPGDVVTFVEELTDDKLKSAPVQVSATSPPPAPSAQPPASASEPAVPGAVPPPQTSEPGAQPVAPAGEPAAPLTELPGVPVELPIAGPERPPEGVVGAAPVARPSPAVTYPIRTYVVRGVTRSGRPGAPSGRVAVPIVPLPPPPSAVAAAFTEKAVTLTWTPPAPAAPAIQFTFHVYAAGSEAPLNATALAAPAFEHPGAEFGKEQCFTVRTVHIVANVSIESDPSAPACVTPRDIFPPAAPKGLRAVSGPGAINLIWDPNTEPDLAGYIVLRGEAPGGTLQPLTPAPIHETTYRDATVTAGVRYVYVVMAVDNATPPNTSPPTAREEETAR
jgi:hypothetical protein